ncbi:MULTISPECIES: MarR family winged helix-turn-helix transcriptional regulator [Levilactobacillus]|nr:MULTISPECIES: MarR family transcriptional regulator [Levilactobacillus]
MPNRRLGAWLRDAEHQMDFEMNEFSRQYNLTGMQMSVIDFLGRQGTADTYQLDVEQEFHVQRSTASVMIRRMVERDLVSRVVASGDSRKRQLQLTAKGQQLVPIVTTYLEQQDAKMLAGMTANEAAAFRHALQQVSQWGQSNPGEESPNGK